MCRSTTIPILLMFLSSLSIFGQIGSANPTVIPNTIHSKEELFEKNKIVGMQYLSSAEAEAKALEPTERGYMYVLLSDVYELMNQDYSKVMLEKALQTSFLLHDDDSVEQFEKERMQRAIIRRFSERGYTEWEMLLPKMSTDAKKYIRGIILGRKIAAKDVQGAYELAKLMLGEGPIEVGTLSQLMRLLPHKENAKLVELFHLEKIYLEDTSRLLPTQSAQPQMDDFTRLIVIFWQNMPADTVIESCQVILAEAHSSQYYKIRNITLSNGVNTVTLKSYYELRVFELLPVIQELNEELANRLINENLNLKSLFQQFPMGIQSLDPSILNPTSQDPKSPKLNVQLNSDEANAQENKPAPTPVTLSREQTRAQRSSQSKSPARAQPSDEDNQKAADERLRMLEKLLDSYLLNDRSKALDFARSLHDVEFLLRVASAAANASDTRIADEALDEVIALFNDHQRANRPVDVKLSIHTMLPIIVHLRDLDRADRAAEIGFEACHALLDLEGSTNQQYHVLKQRIPSANCYAVITYDLARLSPKIANQYTEKLDEPGYMPLMQLMVTRALMGFSPRVYFDGETMNADLKREGFKDY